MERLETWQYDDLQDDHPRYDDSAPLANTSQTSPPVYALAGPRPANTTSTISSSSISSNDRTTGKRAQPKVEMDTTTARDQQRSALAAETWTSAFLLGGALGSMGLFALLLLVLTAGWPGR